MRTLLRVSTAGNVDDGKSTLIGRLLMETGNIPTDTLESVRKASAKDFPGGMDYSLLTDGLSAEREQKITIDVAYRYFSTEKRQFILADTPGHVQYTRNMATGASTADVAIVLIDARKGLTSQSRRHSIISSLLGISHLIVAVNKMDLVEYSAARFDEICDDFRRFAKRLNVRDIRFLPVSALCGDNVTTPSQAMPWHRGETLLGLLEGIYTEADHNHIDLRIPVQRVVRAGDNFRGYSGQVASGVVRLGDSLAVLPSGFEVRVTGLETARGSREEASCQEAVTLTLDREVDISRGDVLAPVGNLPQVGTAFEATLIWFDEKGLDPEQSYLLKLATQWSKVRVESVRYKLNVENLRRLPATGLEMNDIGRVSIRATRSMVFDAYSKSRTMGSFILVDPITLHTAAAGMILDRRSSRPSHEPLVRSRSGQTILLTGLSGSGKSTVAGRVEKALKIAGHPVKWLDGDILRQGLSSDLGFSAADRLENLRRMAEVAKLFNQEGVTVVCSFIAPKVTDRERIRSIVGVENFIEIFVDAPLEVCQQRDPKGWYKMSRDGKVKEFTGIDAEYEVPEKPNLKLQTDQMSISECADRVLELLNRRR